jgi:small-conductance mechanosensitive channel
MADGSWFTAVAADPTVLRIAAVVLALGAIAALSSIFRRTIHRYVDGADTQYRLRKVTTVVSWVAAGIVVAIVFSDRLGNLTLAVGIAGAGIAFALQEVITSLAGWLAVVFGGFYGVGDRVQLGGIRGDVIDVGMLRTTIMECGQWVNGDLYNGRIVRIANSFVFKEPVFNYSGDFPFLWDEVVVPIKYGSDHHLAHDVIERVAAAIVGRYDEEYRRAWERMQRKYRIEAQTLAPLVTMVANENWIEFTVRYVVGYRERRATKDRLFRRLLHEIDASGGKIGIAAATLNIEKMVVEHLPEVQVAPSGNDSSEESLERSGRAT